MSADKHPAEVLADRRRIEGPLASWQREAEAMLRRIPALEAERDQSQVLIKALEAEREELRFLESDLLYWVGRAVSKGNANSDTEEAWERYEAFLNKRNTAA